MFIVEMTLGCNFLLPRFPFTLVGTQVSLVIKHLIKFVPKLGRLGLDCEMESKNVGLSISFPVLSGSSGTRESVGGESLSAHSELSGSP